MTASLLAHRVTGNPAGPPVLLLNGGMMTMAAWERIAAPLADTYRVVRCDLRGQLLSPGEPEPNLAVHVTDAIALLDFLEIDRIHAAGTSYGALVALKLAVLHPERAASVIPITTGELITPGFWEATVRVRSAALAAAAGGDGGIVLDLILPATYSPEYLEANAALLAAHRHQTSLLPAIWFLGLAGRRR
jgi:pimeloyl-ACP methyl ester carboxylesterase